MKFDNYFKKRNFDNGQKLKEILMQLPVFCFDFFRGIESRTTPLTRLNYADDLKIFFYFLTTETQEFYSKPLKDILVTDLNLITSTHLEMFLQFLSGYNFNNKYFSNSEKGKSRKLSTVRSFLKYFYKKEKINENVSSKVDAPKIHDKEIVRLEIDEVVKLLSQAEQPDNQFTKRQNSYNKLTKNRDLALLTLMLGTGIRVSECVGLNLEDFDFNINGFKVTRKGGNQVVLYFSNEVSKSLCLYMTQRIANKEVSPDEKALFLSLQNKRLSVRAVEKLVKKYSKSCIPLKNITPHKLRSTYGTNLYRETKDIYIVADVLGHKDVNTTKKHYAAISEDTRRSVANIVKLRD